MNPETEPHADQQDLGRLVSAVFAEWQRGGVDFLVLRNYEKLPAETGNDIDVLVRPAQLAKAELILIQAARGAGYQLHNRAEFSPVSLFFHQKDSLQQIQFDLFPHLKWRGFALLPVTAALDQRIDRGLFSVPHPAHEAVTSLLTRLMYHGYVKEDYKTRIHAGFKAHPAEATTQLAQLFGDELAAELAAAIQDENWMHVESRCGALRRQLIWRQTTRQPLVTLGSLFSDLPRFAGRLIRPPGVTVVLAGADGCGKSTAAEKLTDALRGTFHPNKSLRVHWKPAVFFRRRRAARLPTTDPHGRPPRGKLVSLLFLAYHWLEFLIGNWLQFRPVLFRNGLVLIDRYHYDFVVDPRRFRLASLPGLAARIFGLLPAPDLIFLLDAPPEVLQRRKTEVPLAETARQRAAYRDYLGALPGAHIINADQPPETVARELTRLTLAAMASRRQRRLKPGGLDVEAARGKEPSQ